MQRRKYKNTFDRIFLENRWRQNRFMRPCDWTIIGIHHRFAGWDAHEYQFCFFGLSIRVWFKRELI